MIQYNEKKCKAFIYLNGEYIKIKKGYVYENGYKKIYSAGNIVTYYVDSSTAYQEEVDSGATCLSPTTFTPTKSGWTFVGWREDTTASSSVLTSKVMGDEPVTLYAVFAQNITVTYYDNSTTAKTTSSPRYYNNGNSTSASFKLAQSAKSGWTVRGWSIATTGNGAIAYNNNTTFTLTANTTLYGMYQKTCTLTAISYNSTQTATGTAYYNSNGTTVGATTTTPTGASYSGWTWRGWGAASTTTANASVSYANGATYTLGTSDATIYGLYSQTITVTYYNGSTTASSTTGTRYFNVAGNIANPSFTLTQTTLSGWTARGWSTSNAGNASITYSNGATFTRDSNITLYGLYQQTIYLYTVANGTTSTTSGTRYWAPAGYVNPTFTVSNPSKSGTTFQGWSASTSSTSIVYSSISNLSLTATTTLYAVFKYGDMSSVLNGESGETTETTIYIDATLYSTITLTSSNMGGAHVGRVFNPSGVEILTLHTSTTSTNSISTTISTTGYYNITNCSNYAYSNQAITITVSGKTVVG